MYGILKKRLAFMDYASFCNALEIIFQLDSLQFQITYFLVSGFH